MYKSCSILQMCGPQQQNSLLYSADYVRPFRLSVRLSDTRGYSIETAKHIIKLFSPSASHTILVFWYQTVS